MTSVLLVDDEPGVLFTLSELVVDRGHRAITARNGTEALAKLDDADAVVTDLSMPGMSGLDLIAQIAQRDPSLPVILLTAHGNERVAVQAMRQGAYDYIAKPFDIDEVGVMIERALETRRLRVDNRKFAAEQTLGKRIIGDSKPMRRKIGAASSAFASRGRECQSITTGTTSARTTSVPAKVIRAISAVRVSGGVFCSNTKLPSE